MDLGIFAGDPRIRHNPDGLHIPRRHTSIIISEDGTHGAVFRDLTDLPDFAGTVEQCLAFVLGEPHQVGPDGITGWMHTDGRVYQHDPATTGMIPAGTLGVGDVVDWPHLAAFTIAGPAVNRQDELGQWRMAYPVELADGSAVYWHYSADVLVPVRFQD